MACACKMNEHAPLGAMMRRGDGQLTDAELVNMRLHKGEKPLKRNF